MSVEEFTKDLKTLFTKYNNIKGPYFNAFINEVKKHNFVLHHHKFSAQYLRTLNFSAETLIDIGVDQGTPSLYETFKGKKIILIDPRIESIKQTCSRYTEYSFETFNCGIGNESGSFTLNLMPALGHSSFLSRNDDIAVVEKRNISICRLDTLIQNSSFPKPYGIKIDTEGYELKVLQGAEAIMKDVEFVIGEISVKNIYDHGYRFSEVIEILSSYGFELFDTLNSYGRPPTFIDVLFLKKDDPRFIL